MAHQPREVLAEHFEDDVIDVLLAEGLLLTSLEQHEKVGDHE
jgi:hypothetical protein